MAKVEFYYNNTKTTIQCEQEDKIEIIIQKFLLKCSKNKEDVFFLYVGSILDKQKTFKETANESDKSRNQMNVIVNDNEQIGKVSSLKRSKYVTCPQCNDNIYISINDYKIELRDCKNGHKINNILFNEFKKTQYIDISKIKCEQCKKINKSETFGNQFFICYSCNVLLCPLCKSSHNKEHYIIDYDQKYYTCKEHKESYISYCEDCKKDVCILCIKNHSGHILITYGDIMPDIDILETELDKLKKTITEYKKYINEIILKLNKLMENLDEYYLIYDNLIHNFDVKNRNYYVIKNINDMNNYNIYFMNIINTIINEKNIKSKLYNTILMSNKMTFKEEKNDNKIEDDDNKTIVKENQKSKIAFATDYKVLHIMELNDGRILTYQSYSDNEKEKYKVCIYNLKYDIVTCDICSDTNYSDYTKIIQMDDDNLIKKQKDSIQVFKINKYSLEEVQIINNDSNFFSNICKISNEKILLNYNYRQFIIYLYQNGKLIENKKFHLDKESFLSVFDLCAINENEVVLNCSKYGFFGINFYLTFYDLKNIKEIKALKINFKSHCFIREKDCLIISSDEKLILIDIINKRVIKEITLRNEIYDIYKMSLEYSHSPYILVYDKFRFYLYHILYSDTIELSSIIKSRYDSVRLGGIYSKNKVITIENKKVKIKNIFEI